MTPVSTANGEWKPTACILCECNCGIEVRLGGEDGRRFERIRGDKAHPASQGYTCEKALRLDHYQNGRAGRVLHPMRRRPDGIFEEIDWDTAIAEVAERLAAVRDTYGGESIFYYGGGGQGNHLGGAHSPATLRALGARFRSSALAQEKTGEFWVNHQMLGAMVRADFEHCEVAVFVGKNPWQSHSIPRARTTLKEIARDPDRCLVVIDPRRTETAELADIHLQVRPGTDAWLLAALAGVLVQEDLVDRAWLAEHAAEVEATLETLAAVPVAAYCAGSGVEEDAVRGTARRIAAATGGVSVFEDLGVQMNRHSTLVSWLEKVVWVTTGNFARPGAQYSPSHVPPAAAGPGGARRAAARTRDPRPPGGSPRRPHRRGPGPPAGGGGAGPGRLRHHVLRRRGRQPEAGRPGPRGPLPHPGPTLPDGAVAGAVLWGAAHRCAQANPEGVRRAGFGGDGLEPGERLFDAIVSRPSGVVITDDSYDETWRRVRTPDGRVHLTIPELLDELAGLQHEDPAGDPGGPSSSPPVSGAPSPPTRSCVTRPGGSVTPPERSGSAPRTPSASAWSTGPGPGSPPGGGAPTWWWRSTTGCSPATWPSPTGWVSTMSKTAEP
jgi:hypothetical protein